jgi:hypothetical protein
MRGVGLLAAFAAVLGGAPAFAAASFGDKAFVDAAGNLMTVDRLRARCPEANAPPLSNDLAAWERKARIPELRRTLAAVRQHPQEARSYAALDESLGKLLGGLAGRECDALRRWLALPQAQAAWTGEPPAAPRTAAAIPAPAGARPAAKGDIQGYGLITQYGLGYGGMVTFNFEPVVLYRSGDMLKDLKGLANPAGATADRAANPKRWTRWRLAGGVYEYAQTDGKWGKIYNNKVWATPPLANLSGRYVTTGGGGNTAMGGTDAVFVQTTYEFLPGGRLVRDGFASATSSFEGGGARSSTVTGARQGARAGRYTVDGLFMNIAYDDGGRDRVTFMTHPSDPDIIWINGADYIRKGR